MQGPSKTSQRLGLRVFAGNVIQRYFGIQLVGGNEKVCAGVLTTEADREQTESWKQPEKQIPV